jgi:hypothetical protein
LARGGGLVDPARGAGVREPRKEAAWGFRPPLPREEAIGADIGRPLGRPGSGTGRPDERRLCVPIELGKGPSPKGISEASPPPPIELGKGGKVADSNAV